MLNGDVEAGHVRPADPVATLEHVAKNRRQHDEGRRAIEINADTDFSLSRGRRADA